jgi:nucleoside 2-deoxyribosyltransferase
MTSTPLTVFVATSKRFYPEAKPICERLKAAGLQVFHPYFDRHQEAIEMNLETKAAVTREHFPEIDTSDVLYAFIPMGYAEISVAVEMSYAFAKGKRVVVSEPPTDGALRALMSQSIRPEDFIVSISAAVQ